MSSRLKIGHLILIFAVAALPFAATFAFYYPDERHYTDGALEMVKGHGWLIPKNADGSPRFEKPPLAYWAIAASYKIFGVSVFTSRLPFLLASCETIFLAFLLARKLTGNSETALLAAIVLLSHPQFFLCSVRAIPDSLLVFFVTLSAFGFLRLVVFEEFADGAFCAAYFGAAGAVLSKGLLGFLIVVFAWAFYAFKNQNWRALKKIIHWPIFSAAVILAGSWFVYIFSTDSQTAWRQFFGDQVSGNFHGHLWSPVLRAPLFALILIFNFLPWSAAALEIFARKKNSTSNAILLPEKRFILAWTAILILGFSLGANVSLRYLLPATPLLAMLIADCLQRAETARLIFSVGRLFKIALAILILLDAIVFFVVSQWPLPKIFTATVCLLILATIFALAFGVFRKNFTTAAALGIALPLGSLILFVGAMPILLPDRAQQITAALEQGQIKSQTVLLVGGVQLASRVRVCLGKNWTVTQRDRLDLNEAEKFDAVLLPEKDAFLFANDNWKIQTAATGYLPPQKNEIWRALQSPQLPEMLSRHAEKIILAVHN